MKQIEIFTDGACSGNPGPGGWGAVLRYKQYEKAVSYTHLDVYKRQVKSGTAAPSGAVMGKNGPEGRARWALLAENSKAGCTPFHVE